MLSENKIFIKKRQYSTISAILHDQKLVRRRATGINQLLNDNYFRAPLRDTLYMIIFRKIILL